jgi:general secretion pathway protein G
MTSNQFPNHPPLIDRLFRRLVQLLIIFLLSLIIYTLYELNFAKHPRDTKKALVRATLSNFQTILDAFFIDNARYPTTTEGLNALLENPGLQKWNGPYIKKTPIDPWGNPYNYTPPSAPPTLSSNGPDALPNTPDDIKNP